MVGLGDLEGGFFESKAYGISADGTVVVGRSKSTSGWEAFRWENDVMVGLGDLEGGDFNSMAFGASDDGAVVVGAGFTESGYRAFIWDADNGMRDPKEVLVNDFGLNLTGWTLEEAYDVSDDGLVIVGQGINPTGDIEAWRAVIPEPATLLLLCGAAVPVLLKRRRKSRA
jgi:probable HAF family extracellular repeat protein